MSEPLANLQLRITTTPPHRRVVVYTNPLISVHAEKLYNQLTRHGTNMIVELLSITFNKVLKSNIKP